MRITISIHLHHDVLRSGVVFFETHVTYVGIYLPLILGVQNRSQSETIPHSLAQISFLYYNIGS